MTPLVSPADHPQVRRVGSFAELLGARFNGRVNMLCWERTLAGDFAEVVAQLGAGEGIVSLDEVRLVALKPRLSSAGRQAVDAMLADLRLLREHGLAPELNCIHGYPCEDEPGIVPINVYSFHADSAPVEADTWLCTYHGAPSEAVGNDESVRCVDVPATRAALLRQFGGADDATFREWLEENCYDLHYDALPAARVVSFGVAHLWRITTAWPGSPVLPSVHRAPAQPVGSPPRLLLIS